MNNIPNSLIEKVIDESVYRPMYRMIMKDRMLRGKTFNEIINKYFSDISPRARKKRRKQLYKMQEWIKHLIDVKYGEGKDNNDK